jgi:hypothetical protein
MRPQVRFGATVGPRVNLVFDKPVRSVQWHYKGDCLVTLTDGDIKDVVAVHQVKHHHHDLTYLTDLSSLCC